MPEVTSPPTLLDCAHAAYIRVFEVVAWIFTFLLPVTIWVLMTSPPHTEVGDGLLILSTIFLTWKAGRKNSLTGCPSS